MTEQTLETGIEIFARLINQEAVKYQGEHTKLYEAYTQNGDIFDTVNKITKALNLEIYDYRGGLYLTPGSDFGSIGSCSFATSLFITSSQNFIQIQRLILIRSMSRFRKLWKQ